MTGRGTVAAAILAKMRGGAVDWDKLPQVDQEFGLSLADAAYAAITHVAAEQGWHMRPDEATTKMLVAQHGLSHSGRERYRAMLAAADTFEWDK